MCGTMAAIAIAAQKVKYSKNLYWMDNFYAGVWYDRAANQTKDVVLKERSYNN